MKALDIVHLMAGIFILAGIALSVTVHPWWVALSAFVGLNLFQFGISKFCPMIWILKKIGVNE